MFYANVYLYIGCEASATSPYFNGKISDVRIYTTALADNDILELYNTPTHITKQNGIHSFEIKEDVSGQELLTSPFTTPYSSNTV